MFTKKQQTPFEKSVQKVVDSKNDCFSRLKHLKIVLENYDINEAKNFFLAHHGNIYYIFFYNFTNQDASLRLKGQKQIKTEYESLLFILEKILTLLPELIERKWQYYSIMLILKKLLNPGNTFKICQEGIRLFLIWYQILGETGDSSIENMFATLVPGLVPNVPNIFARISNKQPAGGDGVHPELPMPHEMNQLSDQMNTSDGLSRAYLICDIDPLIPAHPSEPKDLTCYFLQCFMDYIVSQGAKIQWREPKEMKHRNCFKFLFEKFKSVYLPAIFPAFNPNFSIYAQTLELPSLRVHDSQNLNEQLLACQCVVVRWLAKFMSDEDIEAFHRRNSHEALQQSQNRNMTTPNPPSTQSSSFRLDYKNEWREPSPSDYNIVRAILFSSRSNVNFVHEIFRQAFLMPFTQSVTMRKVVSVYKDWIFCDTSEIPPFMKEPEEHGPPDSIKVGLSAFLRVFIVNGANIFLLQVPSNLFEEQVDMCKRVLNIYRYIVMKLEMNKNTWELLLLVMLHITPLLLPKQVPARKEDFLGGRLAPAFFQTLLVTLIRANTNVYISASLWEQFQSTVESLTQWEELIKEWSRQIDTLTRVMSRYVYDINLNDLPLERQTDRRKRQNKPIKSDLASRIEDAKKSLRLDESMSIAFEKKILTETDSVLSAKPQRQQYSLNDSTICASQNLPSNDANSFSSKQLLVRSASDSHLFIKKRAPKSCNLSISYSSLIYKNATNSRPISVRTRSTDNFCNNLPESPSSSRSSVYPIQSPSPIPGHPCIESTSLKDSPWHIEGNSLGNHTSSPSIAQRSVITGGSAKGWCPESAFILWRRMLGVLGDINEIKDPLLHQQVMECLSKVIENFIKIRDNLGVSLDNMSPRPPSTFIPPIHYFSSWLFKAFLLPDNYKKGKVIAYKLICLIAIRSQEISIGNEFLAMFYLSIHQALHSKDLEIICTIIKYSGAKLFTSGLKGSSLLFFDFIQACETIVNAKETGSFQIPRFEALSLLATLVSLTETSKKIRVIDPNNYEPCLIECTNTKPLILKILMGASRQEQTDLVRCIVLNCLGILIYQEVTNRTSSISEFYPEIINIFIAETRFNTRYLPRIACDMLRLQCNHAALLLESHPSLPRQIIQGLVCSISNHLTLLAENSAFKDYKNLLLSLLFCLGEWSMSIPKKLLISQPKDCDEPSLLCSILQVLNRTVTYVNPGSQVIKLDQSSDSNLEIDDFNIEKEIEFDISPQAAHRKSFAFSDIKSSLQNESKDDGAAVIKLAAQMLLGHLLYFMDHIPFSSLGAARISSTINELDDNCYVKKENSSEELTAEILNAPNVLFFVVNEQTLISFVDLSCDNGESSKSFPSSLVKQDPYIRVVVRDLIGKYSWDCCPVVSNYMRNSSSLESYSYGHDDFSTKSHHEMEEKDDDEDPRQRSDPLDVLLKDIGKCIFTSKKYSSGTPVPTLNDNLDQAEENMMALLSNQHYQEMNFVERPHQKQSTRKDSAALSSLDSIHSRSGRVQEHMYFMYCRQLIDQLGFFFWEKRPKIELLNRNDKILREIRNLDAQKCRETHKIAVFYVADGQEDKNSILLNKNGSEGFERFVSGLGWEVDLETHTGFRGGLQSNRSTGNSAPYYANSFYEVIFHVSTRIPANADEPDSLRRKLTHLGNDEVHIVWSEHSRDYRRGIIPTEFGDVLIVIYPLHSYPGYHRIHVSRKPEVPFFGPLHSGAVIHHSILPDLVRATAINASRAGRLQVPFYRHHFEERARCLETIYKHHRSEKSFEEFSSTVFCPLQTSSIPASYNRSSSFTVAESTENASKGSSEQKSSPFSRPRPMSMSNIDNRPSRAVPSL